MFNKYLSSWIIILVLLPFCIQADVKIKDSNNVNDNNNDFLTQLELGRKIYQTGILPNGEPLTAVGKDGLPFKINRTACMDCHRRSGLGSSESGILIPPITGEYLFKIAQKKGKTLLDNIGIPRPKYNEESLKVLIQTGVNPNGKILHEIMPRYKINDQDSDYLMSYLKSLTQENIPGLKEDKIEFATIITPEMSDEDKQLMLKVMNIYIEAINKDVRQLGHMKSPMHSRYKPFRKWNLHVWELTGNASDWNKQLEKKYEETPVFAFLGGYGNWQPIHEFCELNKIPSLFPITDTPGFPSTQRPGEVKNNFYSLYFSKGIKLDAEAVATKIITTYKEKKVGNILQIFNNDPTSTIAAKAFKNKLIASNISNISNIKDLNISTPTTITMDSWSKIQNKYSPDILVVWLDKKAALHLIKNLHDSLPKQIYLSSRLMKIYELEQIAADIPLSIQENISFVHPFYLKQKNKQHLLRTQIWLRSKKIKFEKERIIANTYFGLATLTSAIRSSSYILNREYLMEQFEHMIDNTVYRSIYPHLSLGPDQRYASKGTYIISISSEPSFEWIIPD